jgi:REP element-mobilizing transposase RayT
VTVCTRDRECLLGEVLEDHVDLSPLGAIVAESWRWLSAQYAYVVLDQWVLMPNHLHGILMIRGDCYPTGRGGSRAAPTAIVRKPLGELIGAFKTVSTKRINLALKSPGRPIWQRGYYEHIIRGQHQLERARAYIATNPQRWSLDEETPFRTR